MAEIEALPNSFPIVLRPPTSPTLRPMYTRMVELGEKFNPLNIGLLLSQVLYIESLRTPVIVEGCGAPGLHFARRQNHIRVCYELIPEVNQLLGKPRAKWFEIDSATRAFLMFAMLHEMAHALIKNLGIPVAGREEDAADQLALLFMTQVPDRELAHRIVRAPPPSSSATASRSKAPLDTMPAMNTRAAPSAPPTCCACSMVATPTRRLPRS